MFSRVYRSILLGFRENKRIVFVLSLLGVLGGLTIVPYQMEMLSQSLNSAAVQGQPPLAVIIVLMVVQTTVMTFLASIIGLSLAQKVGLDTPFLRSWLNGGKRLTFSKKWLFISVAGSFLGSLLMIITEVFVFQPHLPKLSSPPAAAMWKSALTMFYGGIVEEVLLRLFLMTLLIWILAKGWRSPVEYRPPCTGSLLYLPRSCLE